jgi:cytoskeleton protein RodZ
MNTFSEELLKERVSRDISLQDISSKTHISIKFLEAIEQGSFDVLPQPYIRAFLREYALVIGISPVEVLRKYDIMVAGKYSPAAPSYSGSGWTAQSLPSMEEQHSLEKPDSLPSDVNRQHTIQKWIMLAAVLLGIVLVCVYIFQYLLPTGTPPLPQETPFHEIVKEKESKSTADTSLLKREVSPVPGISDSLHLNGTTTDSVWITVIIDAQPPRSLLLPPHISRSWSAKEKFLITLGNAGAIRFTLNTQDLGTLGSRGSVLRNYVITPAQLTGKR